MKAWQACRESAKLVWQRPVVSLPVLLAAITPFVLNGMDSLWKRLLLPPPIAPYGVSSPFSQLLTQSAKETLSAHWPLILANIFLQAAVCAIALFVTAGAIRRLTSEKPTALLRSGLRFARSRWRSVISLSLVGSALLATYAAMQWAVFYFSVTHLANQASSGNPSGQLEVWMLRREFEVPVFYILLWCIGFWILTGMAMRRIGTDDLSEVSDAQIHCGRRAAIMTVLISWAVGIVLTGAREIAIPAGGLVGTVAEWELNAIQALIVAFPYALLFIVLTLIVDASSSASPVSG